MIGIFVCVNGTSSGKCQTTDPTPNITTTLSFFRREATVLASKSNLTILSIPRLTDPIPVQGLDAEQYRAVLAWLLDYEAAGIPAPSSLVENFWSAKDQLQNEFSDAILLQNFRSILAFPLWLFNANNYGNTGLEERVVQDDLPPEFYTKASIVAPITKIKFNPVMIFLFVAFQGIILLLVWVVFVWSLLYWKTLPAISSFPAFDVSVKAQSGINGAVDGIETDYWYVGDAELLRIADGVRLHRKVL